MRNVIQWCWNSFFSKKKITKNRPAAGGFAPRPPSIIRLNYSTHIYSTRLLIWTFLDFNNWFKLSLLNEFLVTCQHQATASDLPFYDIFAPTKNSCFEVSDDVIACDLWFGFPQSKILATPMVVIVFPEKHSAITADHKANGSKWKRSCNMFWFCLEINVEIILLLL